MKRIAFATGSRADYGIMRRFLELLNLDKDIELRLLVTGALLDEKYGHQVELIYNDGFDIDVEIPVELDSSSNEKIIKTMAQTLEKFGVFFEKNKYDLLIILGDRYEILSVSIAAAIQRIPILHVHGGEATYGNYDEFIRHAITKMSLYHFTATDEYRRRVIQLGERPDHVFWLGALGAENCLYIENNNVIDKIRQLPDKQYFVVLFHPETLTNIDVKTQIVEVLNAINNYPQYKYVFLGSNADTHSELIREAIKSYVGKHENATYFENVNTDSYHYLLKHSVCLIGNSSSGIIEAPSLEIYTINIGDRQMGRVRGDSVIDTPCLCEKIIFAMDKVIKKSDVTIPINPYYKKDAAQEYYQHTLKIVKKIDEETREPKHFYDMTSGNI